MGSNKLIQIKCKKWIYPVRVSLKINLYPAPKSILNVYIPFKLGPISSSFSISDKESETNSEKERYKNEFLLLGY